MSGTTTLLKFDIELNLSGPDMDTINERVAYALKDIAKVLEASDDDTGYEDGFHNVVDQSGYKIGQLYCDYAESNDEYVEPKKLN